MKSKVTLSAYCKVITFALIILLIIGIVSCRDNESKLWALVVVSIALISFSLFYFPTSIETTNSSLIIHRFLKSKIIPYSFISSADTCIPSAGGLRLCGSGGFLGYWGYFNDIIIGTYFGYYGNRNQCILIKLKNGKQYVVSCEEPIQMISSINDHLSDNA